MKRYINVNWAGVREPDVFLHEEGYYIIRFHSEADMKEIYYSGPYTINNMPIILKPWTSNFDFKEKFPIEIPLWVNFPKLPLNCWGVNSLSRIASAIGTPM